MSSLGAGSPFHQKTTEMNTSETAGMTTGAVTSRDGPRTGYPPLGQGPDATVTQAGPRRRLLTVPGVTGIAFTLSWIAGLAIPAPSPKLTASGAGIAAAFAGHQAAVVAQFALTEGLPAAGLAIVSVVLARAARRSGAAAAARFAYIAGVAAAGISLAQFVLGMVLAGTSAPGTAHLLYDAVNRLDGAKMFALAAFGLAGAASGMLPRWLQYTGIALALAMASSGLPYLLLLQGGAVLAYVSGPLLLLFITGTGIALGTSAGKPPRVTEPALTHPSRQSGASGGQSSAELRVIPPTGAAKNPGQRMTPVRDAGPARPGGPAGQPGIMTIKIRRVVRQLSAPLVVLVAALLAAGVISGLFSYLDRSSVRERSSQVRRPGGSNSPLPSLPALRSATAGGGTSGGSAGTATACGYSRR